MMKKQAGFTLIELAVVIAIIAILAAVAIPRFANTTASAERSMINNMVGQLTSAYAMATAEQAAAPTAFTQFVTRNPGTTTCGNGPAGPRSCTLNISDFGPNGGCTVGGTAINCANAFNSYTGVRYTLQNGVVRRTGGNPVGGAPPL